MGEREGKEGVRKFAFYLSLLGGLSIVLLSVYGFFLLRSRPGLPLTIKPENLIKIDNFRIENITDTEFVLTQKSIGDWATFLIKKDGQRETLKAQIIPFYSTVPFPLIYLFIGLFCFLIGFLVFVLRRENKKARILYWLALMFGFLLIVNGGTYCLRKEWSSYLPLVPFYLFYPLAPAVLVHFSYAFSPKRRRFPGLLVYGPAMIIGLLFVSTTLLSTLRASIEIFRFYLSVFRVFRIYLIVLLLLSIYHFVRIYRKTILAENKAQIKWVFLGVFFGLSPFIFAYQIPTIFKVTPLISEQFCSVFYVFVPLGFAVSILKFKLLDVELVINRSLVYSLLTVFTVSVYLFSVRLFQDLFSRIFPVKEASISLGSALLAAIAFHPARKKIQELVDRSFFRQAYDYRKAVLKFSDMAKKALGQEMLIDMFMMNLKEAIPPEKASLAVRLMQPEGCRILFSRGLDNKSDLPPSFGFPPGKIWARRGAANTEEGLDFSEDSVLVERKIDLVFPFPFASTSLNGYLALERKKSGERFTREDIDLLVTLVGELSLNLERIRLCEEVIYEKASKEKLDELNRLKTEFISTFSHELRTPMSSIQGLTEILQEGKIRNKAKKEELLAIVASESGRLSRLVHNILDFGKIEQQIKTYHFQRTEVGPVIEDAVRVFRFKLDTDGFNYQLNVPGEPVFLELDRDAVKQVLINLIDNAMKYSSANKRLEISLLDSPDQAEIQVKDEGIGIPLEEQAKIFDTFYRASGAKAIDPKGAGLGLKVVKHIMAAHKGTIRVESKPSHGSTFTLVFPRA